jgi:DNA-binding beta-propeller fold protein YncE
MSGFRRPARRPAGRQVAVLSLTGLAVLLVTTAALAATGDLTQSAGTAGCVSQSGGGGCVNGHGLNDGPADVAVSPDGKSVYVASTNSHSLVRLNRNTTTGALTQPAGTAGCVSEDGTGPCADGHGLGFPVGVAVSPDGKSVYVASYPWSVARFNRNTTTGALTQPAGTAGCVSRDPSDPCALGYGLGGAFDVVVSPDGKSVYVAAYSDGDLVRFNRNTTTGALSQPGGGAGAIGALDPHGVAVSPDGKSVYAASLLKSAVVRFTRTSAGALTWAGCVVEDPNQLGGCADGHGLSGAHDVAVSPDGKSVYAASNNAVARFNRNLTTGAITQPAGTAGCVSEDGTGPCADGHALNFPSRLALSPDGKSLYAAVQSSDAVARLNRNTTTGALTQPAGAAGCVSETGAGPCANGHALSGPLGVGMSPDGKSVYVASFDSYAVARFNRAP